MRNGGSQIDSQNHFVGGAEALTFFCNHGVQTRQFTTELKSILEVIAVTGNYWHNWRQLKMLLAFRLHQVMTEYNRARIAVEVGPPRPLKTGESFEDLLDRLQSGLDSFVNGAPFTLQRLCELLLYPEATYPTLDKLALAFEKLLLVTSTVSPSKGSYPQLPLLPEQLERLSRLSRGSAGQNRANELAMENHNSDDVNLERITGASDQLQSFLGELEPMHLDDDSNSSQLPPKNLETHNQNPQNQNRGDGLSDIDISDVPTSGNVHSFPSPADSDNHPSSPLEGSYLASVCMNMNSSVVSLSKTTNSKPEASPEQKSVPPVTAADIGPQPRRLVEQLSPVLDSGPSPPPPLSNTSGSSFQDNGMDGVDHNTHESLTNLESRNESRNDVKDEVIGSVRTAQESASEGNQEGNQGEELTSNSKIGDDDKSKTRGSNTVPMEGGEAQVETNVSGGKEEENVNDQPFESSKIDQSSSLEDPRKLEAMDEG